MKKCILTCFFLIQLLFTYSQSYGKVYLLKGFGEGVAIVTDSTVEGYFYNQRSNKSFETKFVFKGRRKVSKSSSQVIYNIVIPSEKGSSLTGEVILYSKTGKADISLSEIPPGNLFNIEGGKRSEFEIQKVTLPVNGVGSIKAKFLDSMLLPIF